VQPYSEQGCFASRPGSESRNFFYWRYGSAIATLMAAGVLPLSWLVGGLDVEAERDA
jgi:hypothetical protein